VLTLKKSGSKHFCIVDCALNDLIRPALYDAWQEIIPVSDTRNTPDTTPTKYDIVGPVCENADFLGKDRLLNVKEGEYLAIKGAGAYGFVMSSNYNSRPRAAEVMVNDNLYKVVRERETIEQLFAQEHIW
jgi:diaminopimelate decarboxylase